MNKITKDELEILSNFCDDMDYELRENYSGRCMYGDSCIGFVAEDNGFTIAMNLVEFLTAEESNEADNLIETFKQASINSDSMGLSSIIYFPNISIEETEKKEI